MSKLSKSSGQRSGEDGKKGRSNSPNKLGQYIVFAVLAGMLAAAAAQIYSIIFPDRATFVDVADKDKLHEVFYSGKPHFVVCTNGTQLDMPTLKASEDAIPFLRMDDVETVSIDCFKPLPSGLSVVERFKLSKEWKPVWFVVANGKRPEQLSPALARGLTSELTGAVKKIIENRATSIGNMVDLDRCFKDRVGGCVIVYSSRERDDIRAQLAPVMNVHRTVTFSNLDARKLAFAPKDATPLETLITNAIRNAKEFAAQAGARGELLLFWRRAPKELTTAISSDSSLLTVGYTHNPGQIEHADLQRLFHDASRAHDHLNATVGSEDAMDLLLERDDSLLDLNTAVVNRGDLLLTRAGQQKQKKAAPTAAPVTDDGAPSAAARKARRDAMRKEQSGTQPRKAASTPEPELAEGSSEEDILAAAARERRRREEMAEEERESGHYAYPIDGDSKGDEEEEEFMDLDELQVEDDII